MKKVGPFDGKKWTRFVKVEDKKRHFSLFQQRSDCLFRFVKGDFHYENNPGTTAYLKNQDVLNVAEMIAWMCENGQTTVYVDTDKGKKEFKLFDLN